MSKPEPRLIDHFLVDHRGLSQLQLMIDTFGTVGPRRQIKTADASRIPMTVVVFVGGDERVLFV